ncbi:MAG: hypothetical protein JJU29_01720 [Verrucomicrobia bacterium]|nr:hypothetical protein [Verrucomicrobiota bacterium]MCH8510951.1 hypothetical protein [Kiritimatiellia bacterium]
MNKQRVPKVTNEVLPVIEIQRSGVPEEWRPSLRILLFDDQYEQKQIIEELNECFGMFCHCDKHSVDNLVNDGNGPKLDYEIYAYKDVGVEIVLCNGFTQSLSLIGEHFDILLLDIDFSNDKSMKLDFKNETHLGGILFGFCYMGQTTICQIFTAQHSDVRRNNIDYWYLDQATSISKRRGLQILPQLYIEVVEKKRLAYVLRKSFRRWCTEILPSLNPNKVDLLKLVDGVLSKKPEGYIEFSIKLRSNEKRKKACKSVLPGKLFASLLTYDGSDLSEDSKTLVNNLARQICGHQFVYSIFCKPIHVSQMIPDDINLLLNRQPGCKNMTEKGINDWHLKLEQACQLFEVNYEEFVALLKADINNCCRSHTRIDICKALGIVSSPTNATEPAWEPVLHGIFRDSQIWGQQFRRICKDLLISKDNESAPQNTDPDFHLKYELLNECGVVRSGSEEPWARRILIWGDRSDCGYLSKSANGGSWSDLISICQLARIASSVCIIGSHGSVNMITEQRDGSLTSDMVTLEIIVHQPPTSSSS